MILGSAELRALWESELGQMRERIAEIRKVLAAKLAECVPHHDFRFITKQRGLFSFSGLELPVLVALREKPSVYALDNGRICIAALNSKNIDYVVDSIAQVLQDQSA
jgi:aromatic-amino-acid transaminase